MSTDKKVSESAAGSLWPRRKFVGALAVSAASATVAPEIFAAAASRRTESRPKKIALLVTEDRKYSHGQHFIDRFLEGYGWEGRHHRPPFEVSLYIDQFPEGDLARESARRHNVTIYPTIAEALTLGGSRLAVDGVVIVAEHGRYSKNEKGQTLYPRYSFFKQAVKIFEDSGRAVPVFNDKHLSTDWKQAVEMVEDSKRLGFPFLAGSSLPVTWRIPSLEIPVDLPMTESVCACYGGVDSYDFHGLETAQCMSERRRGGETGVRSIHAVKGEKVWAELERRPATAQLLLSALNRSHSMLAPVGYTFCAPTLEWIRHASPNTVAYFLEHRDGFQTAMFLLNGGGGDAAGLDQKSRDVLWGSRFVRDFTYAGRAKSGKIFSCQMHLPMPPWQSTLADFFNPLVHHVEEMILDGRPAWPIERTLLTTGMTMFAVESLFRGEVQVETPDLKIAYRGPAKSNFWRT
jgi:hypothetical protein